MKVAPAHACLIRKLYRSLSPAEWKAFVAFCRQITFDGERFEQLTAGELDTLSGWCNRAR